jgi:hypothetical protein
MERSDTARRITGTLLYICVRVCEVVVVVVVAVVVVVVVAVVVVVVVVVVLTVRELRSSGWYAG